MVISFLKSILYFPVAYYFRFFAQLRLKQWNPRTIVITGSSGKTTLLNLIEAQLGNIAKYSHHANSSYGIPFNILDLERKTLSAIEWPFLFLLAPIKVFAPLPSQKIYIVEADCDRPFEGQFLSSLLNPEATIWLSSSKTHSMNFDKLVKTGIFKSVDEAIAYEYGYFLEKTSNLVITNSDLSLISRQLTRTKAQRIEISKNEYLELYDVSIKNTSFKIKGEVYRFKYLLPEAVFSSVAAAIILAKHLEKPVDSSFREFDIPPGRSSVFRGVRNTTIVDSCYNSNFSSASEIINMFNKIKADKKWVVIGDMLEQGKSEKEEHEKLAELIIESKYDKVVLLGPRIITHGLPQLREDYKDRVVAYTSPKDVLEFLNSNIKGGETILFKGARFMEGIIENLLLDKSEAKNLSRREKIWEVRRKKWGL